jgi:hypothetical protein
MSSSSLWFSPSRGRFCLGRHETSTECVGIRTSYQAPASQVTNRVVAAVIALGYYDCAFAGSVLLILELMKVSLQALEVELRERTPVTVLCVSIVLSKHSEGIYTRRARPD